MTLSQANLSPMNSSQPTPSSALDRLADRLVEAYAASDPVTATYVGVAGHDDRWPDLTPDGIRAHAELLRSARAEAEGIEPADRGEEVARGAMVERLGAELDRYDA